MGLIHISQLSWDRIKHANEVLEVGQKVKVKIQKIDPATGKIGLGLSRPVGKPLGECRYEISHQRPGQGHRVASYGLRRVRAA